MDNLLQRLRSEENGLQDVLYVPSLGTNLFSIGTATNSGLEARFSDDQVSFFRWNDLVLTGKRTGNTLYLLDLDPQTAPVNSRSRIDSAQQAGLRTSLLTWHQRLGHMKHQTILKMISQELVWSSSHKSKDPENTVPHVNLENSIANRWKVGEQEPLASGN